MKETVFNFEGKTAVVTGASRGIGRAIANAFLKSGAAVINLSKSKQKERKDRPRYSFFRMDVSDLAAVESWIENYGKNGGRIDFWINNAGILISSRLLDVTEEAWDDLFNTNLKALFFASTCVARHMQANGGGVIINASSFSTIMPTSLSGMYAASKAAVTSLTKSMAAEWAKDGIRVNSYCPGFILTDMTRDRLTPGAMAPVALSRYGTPEEVARVVLFLCSDAASYITGEETQITGGKFLIQDQKTR